MRRWLFGVAAIAFAMIVHVPAAHAQLAPNEKWRTLDTKHFRVYFTAALELQARRAAANAEEAYTELSRELTPPRGRINLVVADNVDYTNGYAVVSPWDRIVVFADPPVNVSSLRLYGDWNTLVVTHELTHIFQNDRVGGWWRAAQAVFGRSPYLFPSLYAPKWVQEGLAVYYESHLTGFGRLDWTDHAMIARADVLADRLPGIADVSYATPLFPYGNGVYVYGSLLIDDLARTQGRAGVGRFVERLSRAPVPFVFLDHAAKSSFGVSLEDAWRAFADSVRRDNARSLSPSTVWRVQPLGVGNISTPRWLDSTTVIYAAAPPRESPGLYRTGLDGRSERIGRRNTIDANAPLGGGSVVFAQLEYTDPYHIRSDLFVQRGSAEHRLTTGARLSEPDARHDGAIVAVQTVPATTRLVRVSPDGRTIVGMTAISPDTQWAEPRWSPDGGRIVAVRHLPDGQSEIVVLDTLGRVMSVLTHAPSVDAGPAWSPDGQSIVFSSDRSGVPALYRVAATAAAGGANGPTLIATAATGVSGAGISPGGGTLSATLLSANGYHVGSALLTARPLPDGSAPRPRADTLVASPSTTTVLPVASDVPSHPYRPWSSLLPHYWLPTVTSAANSATLVGALTTGQDIVERHSYTAQLQANTRDGDIDGSLDYSYQGLTNPVLSLALQKYADYNALVARSTGSRVGFLRQGIGVGTLSATFVRRRYRSSASLAIGAQVEHRTFSTDPDSLLSGFRPQDVVPQNTFSITTTTGWSNTQRPPLSISPEDGVAFSALLRERWRDGGGSTPGVVATAVARTYKSLDTPGFAHQVLAWRGAVGFASSRSTTSFGIGGVSGSPFDLLPGYSIGDVSRGYGVRGYAPSARSGRNAIATTLEYRAPLAVLARGIPIVAVFFDRLSGTAFFEAACAWTPAPGATAPCAVRGGQASPWLASTGVELNLNAALQYDIPYLFRVGVAHPLTDRQQTGAKPVTAYITLGLPF